MDMGASTHPRAVYACVACFLSASLRSVGGAGRSPALAGKRRATLHRLSRARLLTEPGREHRARDDLRCFARFSGAARQARHLRTSATCYVPCRIGRPATPMTQPASPPCWVTATGSRRGGTQIRWSSRSDYAVLWAGLETSDTASSPSRGRDKSVAVPTTCRRLAAAAILRRALNVRQQRRLRFSARAAATAETGTEAATALSPWRSWPSLRRRAPRAHRPRSRPIYRVLGPLRHHPRPAAEWARFTALEMSPTWLNACG